MPFLENDQRKKRVVIVGAGPTALGCLHRLFQLQENGFTDEEIDVVVVEQEHEVGGLARTVMDPQGFCWDLGIHVTGTSKYPEFLEVLNRTVPEWNVVRRSVKVDMRHVMNDDDEDGFNRRDFATPGSSHKASQPITDKPWHCYVPYPVQNSVPYFPEELKRQCLQDLVQEEKLKQEGDGSSPQNFDTFSRRIFGKTLQDIFIRPYNEKVWTVKLSEMNCKWTEGRVPKIDPIALERRCALPLEQLIAEEENAYHRTYFRYPASGCRGIGDVWRRFASEFPSEVFKFQCRLARVDPIEKKIFVVGTSIEDHIIEGEEKAAKNMELSYDYLLSTIPLTELGRLTGLLGPEELAPLQHSKVVLVGIGLRQPQSEFAQNLSWSYFPTDDVIFYRCTILSNLSNMLTPDPERFWSVLCEIGMKSSAKSPSDEEQQKIIEKTITDLITAGIVDDEAQVCSRWIKVLPHGYPIPTLGRDSALRHCHRVLQNHGIYSRGRFGGWCYEISNQDHSFQSGMELVDRLFLDVPENLYEHGNIV